MSMGSIAPVRPAPTMRPQIERRFEQGAVDLPLLPDVATRVLNLCAQNGELPSIIDAVRSSVEMSAHVLRWANSPLYRPRTAIVSLQQAITRLGARQVRDIALIVTCKTRVFKAAGFDAELRFVFRHSLVTALFAQEIARARRFNVEEAFLCGLLHHIGRPVLFQTIVDLKREIGITSPRTEIFETVDAMHAHAGAELARHWKLPDAIVEAIAWHHQPLDAPHHRAQAAVVLLAADLAHATLEPTVFKLDAVRAHPMLEPLSMYPDQLQQLIDMQPNILKTLEAMP